MSCKKPNGAAAKARAISSKIESPIMAPIASCLFGNGVS